jgi:hypothetical protein
VPSDDACTEGRVALTRKGISATGTRPADAARASSWRRQALATGTRAAQRDSRYRSSMSGALRGIRARRYARRQVLMVRLCEVLGPVLGPHIDLEAHGGRGIVVVDLSRGASYVTRAAPWLPGLTSRADLTRTARGVVDAIHNALSGELLDTANIGPSRPTVTSHGGAVAIRFFGLNGEPLPVVEVPLVPPRG